jgi:hypothetical protein
MPNGWSIAPKDTKFRSKKTSLILHEMFRGRCPTMLILKDLDKLGMARRIVRACGMGEEGHYIMSDIKDLENAVLTHNEVLLN